MGDLANGHECDAFITAFARDIVEKFRSKLLDRTFGDRVRYVVMADDNWEVHLYADVWVEEEPSERFQLGEPNFFPTSDDIVDQTAEVLELDKDEVRRRLEKAQLLGDVDE